MSAGLGGRTPLFSRVAAECSSRPIAPAKTLPISVGHENTKHFGSRGYRRRRRDGAGRAAGARALLEQAALLPRPHPVRRGRRGGLLLCDGIVDAATKSKAILLGALAYFVMPSMPCPTSSWAWASPTMPRCWWPPSRPSAPISGPTTMTGHGKRWPVLRVAEREVWRKPGHG